MYCINIELVMLFYFLVKNFVVVKEVNIVFEFGMIVVIGEIGVGKFIVIDVLSLCMGECVDVFVVCKGVDKVEIIVYFLLLDSLKVRGWLDENELVLDDDVNMCFICCLILKEGCLKVFINGVFVVL